MSAKSVRKAKVIVRAFFPFALLMACAGCATPQLVVMESNYLTYEHAFTDAAAEAARKSAEKQCAQKKQIAVRTSGVCSLTRCTVNYQCMNKADAGGYKP